MTSGAPLTHRRGERLGDVGEDVGAAIDEALVVTSQVRQLRRRRRRDGDDKARASQDRRRTRRTCRGRRCGGSSKERPPLAVR